MNPFENWTGKHWANLAIFVAGLLLVSLQKLSSWGDVPAQFTPANVAGTLIAIIGFARSINAGPPRESYQERKGERNFKDAGGVKPNEEGGQ